MLRHLVCEVHIAVKWVNIISAVLLVTAIHNTLLGVLIQCTAGVNCDRMVMEYVHDESCDMLLNVTVRLVPLYGEPHYVTLVQPTTRKKSGNSGTRFIQEVDLTSRADCMASSVGDLTLVDFISVRTPEGARLRCP
jgi:hypothetical protein